MLYFASLRWTASQFGAVLDMVTDRCSTAGLLMVLSRLYGGGLLSFSFLVLMFIDLFSHWMHVQRYDTFVVGVRGNRWHAWAKRGSVKIDNRKLHPVYLPCWTSIRGSSSMVRLRTLRVSFTFQQLPSQITRESCTLRLSIASKLSSRLRLCCR